MLDHRTMLAGMLWIVGRGASWRELPDPSVCGTPSIPKSLVEVTTTRWAEEEAPQDLTVTLTSAGSEIMEAGDTSGQIEQ